MDCFHAMHRIYCLHLFSIWYEFILVIHNIDKELLVQSVNIEGHLWFSN